MTSIEELYSAFKECDGVSTDTRKNIHNSLFFCLSGETFNGNDFAEEALEKGVRYVVIDNPNLTHLPNTLLVDNTLVALQELSKYHRERLSAPIIAVTGTNGKTTTKELIASVLATSFEVVYTQGNLNNHIGVPLTLLKIKPSTEIAIVEMGANHPKEIETLCSIAQPDYGYITNFGKAHLEGFGSLEGVIAAKSELYTYLMAKKGVIFFDYDNSIQHKKLHNYTKAYGYSFTENTEAYVFFKVNKKQSFVELLSGEDVFKSQLVGNYNATNIAAAVMVGKYFRIPTHKIQEGVAKYNPNNNRSQLYRAKNGNILLLDAYNANPSSMIASLEYFKEMQGYPKILILGDMLELGKASSIEHQIIVDYLKDFPVEHVLLIGEEFSQTNCSFEKLHTTAQAVEWVKKANIKNSFILLKASRGMHLEQVQAVLM